MSSKAPPIPEENLSPKGPGDTKAPAPDQVPQHRNTAPDPEKQGQAGNTKINLTRQGQDR